MITTVLICACLAVFALVCRCIGFLVDYAVQDKPVEFFLQLGWTGWWVWVFVKLILIMCNTPY